MKKLSSDAEIEFVRELHSRPDMQHVFDSLRDSFMVLQTRSQMLLGLITICLTITGFSGHRIAGSGVAARVCVFVGIVSVLLSALTLVAGPLRLQWLSRYRADSIEETLRLLLQRRDARTQLYHLATLYLMVGLTAYVLSLGFYLLAGVPK